MVKIKRPSFVAIGVGQGDAFFLDKGSFTVLVDGGRSIHGFPNQFQKVTKRDSVDILVCTHNDADHALGVLGFLRSGLMSKEVWLPGSWTDRLEDLLLYPERFTEELIANIEEMEVSPEKPLSLQALGDQYSEGMIRQERDNEGTASTDALSEALEIATEIGAYGDIFWLYPPAWLLEEWPYPWYRLWRTLRADHGRLRLFIEVISTATRIREISLAAYHMGAVIHWFEYNDNSSFGGIPDFLIPLNAREILRIRRRRWSALEYLALTTSNKQSLVFLSPESDRAPSLLFVADSDLSFSQKIPWSDGMIITAPHHGSEDNAYAYKRFINATGKCLHVVWVRSDGRFRKRPGNSYLGAPGSRFCTICRGSNYPKQDVRVVAISQKWKPISTRKCCCI